VRRVLAAVGVVVALATVAGCTGVPGSSSPEVVRTIGLGEGPAPTVSAPPEGATRRGIVQGFLDAMAATPDQPDAARAYLDAEAAQAWSGTTVTVVRDSYVVGAESDNNTVQISYQAVGTVSANGVYSPASFAGDGTAATVPATYSLAKNSAGQWRIHTPVPTGLFITQDDFALKYTGRPLYFLDTAGTRLVPDLRYSALKEPTVESFLVAQLAAGPRSDLEATVSPFAATPSGNQRLTVTPGTPTVVQVPGAAALDAASRTKLAAQLAFTLQTSSFRSALQLQDGTQVLDVPGVGTTFDASDFEQYAAVDDADTATATYVRDGAVVAADGSPLSGAIGTSSAALDNAVFDSDGGRTLVAGTRSQGGDASRRRLLVGDASGLRDVGVPTGPLTAPAWAPIGTRADGDEIWVASGRTLYRYAAGTENARPTSVQVAGPNALSGTILSLAFSPEGSRLALVIRSTDGSATQVWLASVVRNGPDVRLDALDRLTPSGISISDAGWLSETSIAAVGTTPSAPAGVYVTVAVDGSNLLAVAPDGLPDRPRTIAVSPRADTQWVGVGTGSQATVWTRSTSVRTWSAPGSGGSQRGSAPSFST
jgi:hypothetical protein